MHDDLNARVARSPEFAISAALIATGVAERNGAGSRVPIEHTSKATALVVVLMLYVLIVTADHALCL